MFQRQLKLKLREKHLHQRRAKKLPLLKRKTQSLAIVKKT